MLSSSQPPQTRNGSSRSEPRNVLVLLDLESRAIEPQSKPLPKPEFTTSTNRARSARLRTESAEAPDAEREGSGESTAIVTPGESTASVPEIDWQLEMEITIREIAPKMVKEWQRKCDDAERARKPRPPGCNRRSYDQPWRPSGSLLQDMRDPDRPRSSVPEPLGDAFPTAPRRPELPRRE
jgi:hypothetical protein